MSEQEALALQLSDTRAVHVMRSEQSPDMFVSVARAGRLESEYAVWLVTKEGVSRSETRGVS